MVVTKDVTAIGDFSRRSDFKLLGDLNNYGSVLTTVGTTSGPRGGALRADDIYNAKGASIHSTSDLLLDAGGSLTNAGSISSAAGLTLSAGDRVSNSGTISSVADLNIASQKLENSGSIESTSNNVTINSGVLDSALMIDNRKGTVSALNGDINIRSMSYQGASDSIVYGGDLISKNLNMNAGQGTSNVDVDTITGIINQTGVAAHVKANTETLKIGEVCLTGDPTYYNTAGNINITGNISVAENLVFVASGNISSVDNLTIRAGDDSTKGYNIVMIAGAQFTAQGGADSPIVNGSTPSSVSGDVTLTGKASKTGGGILMGNNVNILARAVTTSGTTSGGSVAMFAFGSKGDAGKINLGGTSILTGGSLGGGNGSVSLLASATSGNAIQTGIIDTTGGSGFAGQISMTTAPIVSSEAKTVVTYDKTGTRTSTAFLTAGPKTQ